MKSLCDHESEIVIGAMCGGIAGFLNDWWLENKVCAPRRFSSSFFIFSGTKIIRKSEKRYINSHNVGTMTNLETRCCSPQRAAAIFYNKM